MDLLGFSDLWEKAGYVPRPFPIFSCRPSLSQLLWGGINALIAATGAVRGRGGNLPPTFAE